MVEFVDCKDCIVLFKVLNKKKVKEHYDIRKRVKRCVGCEQLHYYYKQKIEPFENRDK